MASKKPRNKYDREIAKGIYVDVYEVIEAFEITCPAAAHAAKKLLATGKRGHKNYMTDLKEAKDSIQRAIELQIDRDI